MLKTKAQREEEEKQFTKDFEFASEHVQSERESDHWYNGLYGYSPDRMLGFMFNLGYTLIGIDAKLELPDMPYIFFTYKKDGKIFKLSHNTFRCETKLTVEDEQIIVSVNDEH